MHPDALILRNRIASHVRSHRCPGFRDRSDTSTRIPRNQVAHQPLTHHLTAESRFSQPDKCTTNGVVTIAGLPLQQEPIRRHHCHPECAVGRTVALHPRDANLIARLQPMGC